MSRRLPTTAAVVLCLLALAACGSSSTTTSSGATTTSATTSGPEIGFEAVPLERGPELASPGTTGAGEVDGITCAPVEQLVYHIHAHLAVFDDGRLYALPGGVGIPGSRPYQSRYGPVAVGGRCYYWLHTHTSDGVFHIESPKR